MGGIFTEEIIGLFIVLFLVVTTDYYMQKYSCPSMLVIYHLSFLYLYFNIFNYFANLYFLPVKSWCGATLALKKYQYRQRKKAVDKSVVML